MQTHNDGVDLTPEQIEANAAGARQASSAKKRPAAKAKPTKAKASPKAPTKVAVRAPKVKAAAKAVVEAIVGGPAMRKTAKPRMGKTQTMIDMLRRAEGATMPDMITASGWNEQSLKWFMKGTLAKKGLTVTETAEGEPPVKVYHISVPETV